MNAALLKRKQQAEDDDQEKADARQPSGLRSVTESELRKGLGVMVQGRGSSGSLVSATALFPSKKKKGHWAVKFHSDGKVFPREVKDIKVPAAKSAAEAPPVKRAKTASSVNVKEPNPEPAAAKTKKGASVDAMDTASAPQSSSSDEDADADVGVDEEMGSGPGHQILTDSNADLHSLQRARLLLEWLIHPITVEQFYSDYWEKKPLLIKRKSRDYYAGWFSSTEQERILTENSLQYGEEVDLTLYEGGTRRTLNPPGFANNEQVTRHVKKGCSVRLLCPQRHCAPLWKLLSCLEEEFGCMCGANTYLTPYPKEVEKGSSKSKKLNSSKKQKQKQKAEQAAGAGGKLQGQGFSPHYDDIEAFVMQVEGEKHWR